MNKKMVKIISIMLLAMMMVAFASSTCFAATGALKMSPNDITPTNTEAVGDIKAFGGKIAGVLQAVGIVVSVVIVIVLGIKYMLGSAEEKAEYKKIFIPYILGAALIFGATSIANIVINFVVA